MSTTPARVPPLWSSLVLRTQVLVRIIVHGVSGINVVGEEEGILLGGAHGAILGDLDVVAVLYHGDTWGLDTVAMKLGEDTGITLSLQVKHVDHIITDVEVMGVIHIVLRTQVLVRIIVHGVSGINNVVVKPGDIKLSETDITYYLTINGKTYTLTQSLRSTQVLSVTLTTKPTLPSPSTM